MVKFFQVCALDKHTFKDEHKKKSCNYYSLGHLHKGNGHQRTSHNFFQSVTFKHMEGLDNSSAVRWDMAQLCGLVSLLKVGMYISLIIVTSLWNIWRQLRTIL